MIKVKVKRNEVIQEVNINAVVKNDLVLLTVYEVKKKITQKLFFLFI